MEKKKSVLGETTFKFIAGLVSKSNDLVTDLTETCSEMDVENEKKPEESSKITIKQNISESDHLASDFETDLKLENIAESSELKINTEEQKDIENVEIDSIGSFGFKMLSLAREEYKKVSSGFGNYLKGCKWSPDGTCIVTNSDDSILRIYDTTNEMLNIDNKSNVELTPSLRMEEPEIIYDYAWYPYMDSTIPATACLFSSSKDNPVHLFDAFTGLIRCSYKGYNHLDELVAAYCISFNSSCSKMYCGYKKCIKIFEIDRPGRNYEDIPISNGQYKLPGIVSCIAFSQAENGVYAVGSYSKYIGIYVENNNEPMCLISDSHAGGLTHLMFSNDGNKLFSGARKDENIFCWDMRNLGKILQTFKRNVDTNQRIYFDLDKETKYLCSGSSDGNIKLWNANNFDTSFDEEPELNSFKAHEDCINGVSFNSIYKLIATSSGQRNYSNLNKKKEKISKEKESDESSSSSSSSSSSEYEESRHITDNSLKIWKYLF